jgi:hypothetical protein
VTTYGSAGKSRRSDCKRPVRSLPLFEKLLALRSSAGALHFTLVGTYPFFRRNRALRHGRYLDAKCLSIAIMHPFESPWMDAPLSALRILAIIPCNRAGFVTAREARPSSNKPIWPDLLILGRQCLELRNVAKREIKKHVRRTLHAMDVLLEACQPFLQQAEPCRLGSVVLSCPKLEHVGPMLRVFVFVHKSRRGGVYHHVLDAFSVKLSHVMSLN